MSKIKVTLINLNAPINSHIEIVLECEGMYYTLNQWQAPAPEFSKQNTNLLYALNDIICSKYTFAIDADPREIVQSWKSWHESTILQADITSNNCADAAQWFLEQYANVPPLRRLQLPLSLNHVALGITSPSFFPLPLTLPGRVMDHAKYHIEKQKQSHQTRTIYDSLINIGLSLSLLAMSVYGPSVLEDGIFNRTLSWSIFYYLALKSVKDMFNGINHFFLSREETLSDTPSPVQTM